MRARLSKMPYVTFPQPKLDEHNRVIRDRFKTRQNPKHNHPMNLLGR